MEVNTTSFTPKMKSKRGPLILMLGVALFLGFVAAIGIWQYLNKAQQQVKELTITRAVVVAAKKIPAGTKIVEADLAIKQLPAKAIPKDYPSSIESIVGMIAKTSLEIDEIVTEGRLVGEGAGGGLAVVIPQGFRAVTVRVNEVSGVGGFLNPGDRVDLISVLKRNEDETVSKTILQNVLVLAVGDKIVDPSSVSEPQQKIVSQVTFALSPSDSEKVALASEVGQMHLVLRPFTEMSLATTQGASLTDVYGYIPSANTANQLENISSLPVAQGNMDAVEIILGDQRTYLFY